MLPRTEVRGWQTKEVHPQVRFFLTLSLKLRREGIGNLDLNRDQLSHPRLSLSRGESACWPARLGGHSLCLRSSAHCYSLLLDICVDNLRGELPFRVVASFSCFSGRRAKSSMGGLWFVCYFGDWRPSFGQRFLVRSLDFLIHF